MHATAPTGHTSFMLVTAAVFHSEIAPYVVVAGFAIQASTADLKLALVMAVATHDGSEDHVGYVVCSVVPHDEEIAALLHSENDIALVNACEQTTRRQAPRRAKPARHRCEPESNVRAMHRRP